MHLWTSDIERESRNKHWITYNIFNKWCWSNYMDTCRITQIVSYLSLSQTSKWIKTLNIKQDTLKLVGDKVGNSLEHIRIGKGTDYNMGPHETENHLHDKGHHHLKEVEVYRKDLYQSHVQ